MEDSRRKIPSIDKLLKEKSLQMYPPKLAKEVLEEVTQKWREKLKIKNQRKKIVVKNLEKVLVEEAIYILERNRHNFKKVINATGVVLNTNLGRAPLPQELIEEIADISSGYSNLEIELKTGERGERYSHISHLLQKLTGAEDSLVVNNNAGAVFLILDTFAKDKEVIVSRGELIEIGGSFRLPDVLKKSGAKLVEVGTTNRTYINDYEQAINENTALLLKTHTSNYKIVGFSSTPSLEEFVKLGKKYKILTVEDIGSGAIIDLRDKGLPYEPTVKETVSSGIDLVSFSGDKLLGGPQAGIILGKKELIDIMKSNPLLRALRVGKHILALLEQIIRIYLYDDPIQKLPHLSILTEPPSSVKARAERLGKGLSKIIGKEFEIKVEQSTSEIGGGSYPGVEIPTFVVTIKQGDTSCLQPQGQSRQVKIQGNNSWLQPHCIKTADEIQKALRECIPPIIARVKENKVLLDARTIFDNEIDLIIKAVAQNKSFSTKKNLSHEKS